MGLWRVTWFFEGQQDANLGAGSSVGWTETWGLNDGINQNIDAVFNNPDVTAYTGNRQSCLSVLYRISFIRVSSVPAGGLGSPRITKIQSLPNIRGGASLLGTGGAQVQCAVLADLMRLPNGPDVKVHHRKFLIRGLPPDVINGNVLNTTGPNWPRFVTFLNFVANKPTGGANNPARATQLGILFQDPTFVKTPCAAITVNAATPRFMSGDFGGIVPYAVGEQIRITGFGGLDGVSLNRVWQFVSTQAVGPPNISNFGKSRFDLEAQVIAAPNAGFYQRVRFQGGPLDQYAIIGLRSKRTGKVFRQLVGRSRRRVRN
jgi:hypothetical protein